MCTIHEEEFVAECIECRIDWENEALSHGIPLSVIKGKKKLTDYYSKNYIDFKCGKDNINSDGEHNNE